MLFYISSIDTIIYQVCQVCLDQGMSPVLYLCWKITNLDAQVVVSQAFPVAILVLFNQDRYCQSQKLLAEEATVLIIQGEQALAACLLHIIFDLATHTCRW